MIIVVVVVVVVIIIIIIIIINTCIVWNRLTENNGIYLDLGGSATQVLGHLPCDPGIPGSRQVLTTRWICSC